MSLTIRRPWFALGRHDDPTTDPTTDPGTATGGDDGGKPAGDPGKTPTFTGEFDPERAARALANAREGEKAAKAAAQAASDQLSKVLAALGKAPDGTDLPNDPEALAAELTAQAQQAQMQAWRAGTTLAIYQAAGKLGANPEALLDSNQFLGLLDDLVEADPSGADFAETVQTRIKEALEKWPDRYAAGGAVSGGTAPAGTPTAPRPDASQGRGGQNSAVDFRTASPDAVDTELAKYRMRPYAR